MNQNIGKKILTAKNSINSKKEYSLLEAITLIKEKSYANFDETLDIAISLGVDAKRSDQIVKGIVALPAGTGKKLKIAVICGDDKIEEAKQSGAEMVGSNDIIDAIKNNSKINFDVCVATPDMMGAIGQIARILGPKGLMPNPKLGTVTNDIKKTVLNIRKGQVEYRIEKGAIIHAGIGKLSFITESLVKNAEIFIDAIKKAKPLESKGNYLKKIYLSSTMGPAIKINLSTITN